MGTMPDLRVFLQQTFEKSGGLMPFENFMAMALYDPNFGYYATAIEDVGGDRGDFATSATLSKGLGQTIAKWIQEERDHHEWEGAVSVIEVGAGNGALAAEILRSFGWWKRRQIKYHIVEVSEPLRRKQQIALNSFPVTWHKGIAGALEETGGKALVFSNELVDAFPAKWLSWSGVESRWHEVFVSFDPLSGISETFRSLSKFFPEENYSALAWDDPEPGQRVEIQPIYQAWLANLARHLDSGSLLTIDYGGSAKDIYDRRPGGSLRGYYRQERIEGPDIYRRFGKQDLTVDVNFDDLRTWGEEFELETVSLESQETFLERHGHGNDPMAGEGVGEAFRVLHQRK